MVEELLAAQILTCSRGRLSCIRKMRNIYISFCKLRTLVKSRKSTQHRGRGMTVSRVNFLRRGSESIYRQLV